MANEFIARKGLIVPTGSITVTSGSVTATNFIGTASRALTASYADSGTGFPFSGSAVITGSLNVTQAVTASFFKGDGSELINLPTTATSSVTITTNTFTGDGSQTQFDLGTPFHISSLFVSVDGLFYTPTVDYNISSSVVTFVSAPPSA